MMYSLLTKWNQDVTFVNGRPRHSQSQGLIERGNREVEKKIAAMKHDRGFGPAETSFPWASWLPEIMFALNIQRHETIKETPYKIVFGRSPLTSRALPNGEERHIIYEEELMGIPVPDNLDDPLEFLEDVYELEGYLGGNDDDLVDDVIDAVNEMTGDVVEDVGDTADDVVDTDVLMGDSLIIEAESEV